MHFVTYMFGELVEHSGWNSRREVHLRFFNRVAVDIPGLIHSEPTLRPGMQQLVLPDRPDLSIVHYNYTDYDHFIAKLNRYTTVEADQLATGEGRRIPTVFSAGREFVRRYLIDGGWRKGRQGLLLCALMFCYRLLVAEKTDLRKAHPTTQDVIETRRSREVSHDLATVRSIDQRILMEANDGTT